MKLYRADKRDFNVGDIIASANEFTSRNPNGSRNIEELFELFRPEGKPNRIGCLYLFENEVVARKHWSKMVGGMLYEVEIDENSILHRGDMRFVDEAFSVADQPQKERCAIEYWDGTETEKPRMEILVAQAIIVKVLSKDQAERQRYLLNWPPA